MGNTLLAQWLKEDVVRGLLIGYELSIILTPASMFVIQIISCKAIDY